MYYLEFVNGITKMSLGSERTKTPINTSPLNGSSAMTIDFEKDRLFICDGLKQILSTDLDGNNSITISLGNRNCAAIAANGARVYYAIDR